MRQRGATGREAGTTLIELLIAIVITGVIMVPLTAGLIVFMKTNNKANAQLSEGNGADITSVYFAPDVRNSVGVSQSTTDCAGGGGGLITLDEGGGTTISYSTRNNQILRVRCTGAGSGLAPTHGLANLIATSPAPAVTCVPSCDANWKTVTLTYTGSSGYPIQLQATRRT